MLQAIESATRSIDIEQFIITPNEVGLRFFEALKKKAREGIKVRLLADTIGSFPFYTSSIPKELEKGDTYALYPLVNVVLTLLVVMDEFSNNPVVKL